MRSYNWKDYRNFDIDFTEISQGIYHVDARSYLGNAEARLDLTLNSLKLDELLSHIPEITCSHIRDNELLPVISLGSFLFDLLFTDGIRELFYVSRHDAELNNHGLRIRISSPNSPDIERIPWEFIYNGTDFLALTFKHPMVRFAEIARPIPSMAVKLPLRILITLSAPNDLPAIDTSKEVKQISQGLKKLVTQGLVEVSISNGTINDLEDKVRQAGHDGKPFHVWHFIGHGFIENKHQAGFLAFEDELGRTVSINALTLGTIFNSSRPDLKVVVLNSCKAGVVTLPSSMSSLSYAFLEQGVPAVVGMRTDVSDVGAIMFAKEFYQSLAQGMSIEASVISGRRRLFLAPRATLEWSTPVLFSRERDGHLFRIISEEGREIDTLPPIDLAPSRMTGSIDHLNNRTSEVLPQPFEWIKLPELPTRSDNAAFAIAKYPITYAQYSIFSESEDGYNNPIWWRNYNIPVGYRMTRARQAFQLDDHPKENVSWFEAMAFAAWLGNKLNSTVRLPTESEWEWAARGGQVNDVTFPWGNEVPSNNRANWQQQVHGTTPVFNYPLGASPLKVFDLAGNVWEWCLDDSENEDSDGSLSVDTRKVLRGGSWNILSPSGIEIKSRLSQPAGTRDNDIGFRLVLSHAQS